jgi:hypothetical protein
MNQIQMIQMKEISEVRNMVVQAAWERPVPEEAAQNARDTMQIMYQEAAKYGLTRADVVRAILRPALENRKSCNCPTCKSRRSRLGQDEPQAVTNSVN